MALSDYIERLRQVSGEGPRVTDFVRLQSERNKARQSTLEELRRAQQRNVNFEGVADQSSGGVQSGNPGGSFNGRLSMYPLKGDFRMSSDFGGRTHPISGKHSNHTGIDWAAGAGTPIYAPGSGTVRSADWNKVYGNRTILDLGGGYSTMFGHQSGFASGLKAGQQIRAGQLIGYVGSTGWSTGPHLHFETWYNNKPVNPMSWFR